jgi:hypothetical protein
VILPLLEMANMKRIIKRKGKLNKSAIIKVKNGIIKSEQGLLLRLQFYSDALGVD